MRLAVYVVFLFALAISAYMFGFRAPATQIFMNQGSGPFDFRAFASSLVNQIMTDGSLQLALGIAAILGTLSLFAGFSALFVIPASMLMLLLNLFVFPISEITSYGCAGSSVAIGASCSLGGYGFILVILFNIFGYLAIVNFIRGSS